MSKKSETLLKERVRAKLERIKKCSIIKIQQVAIRGDPDFVLCVNGFSVWVELKRNRREKADPLQYYKLEKHLRDGGYSFILHDENEQDILRFLRKLAEKKHKKMEIDEWLQLPRRTLKTSR